MTHLLDVTHLLNVTHLLDVTHLWDVTHLLDMTHLLVVTALERAFRGKPEDLSGNDIFVVCTCPGEWFECKVVQGKKTHSDPTTYRPVLSFVIICEKSVGKNIACKNCGWSHHNEKMSADQCSLQKIKRHTTNYGYSV